MADFVIAKKVNGQVVHFFPKTRSDLVMYDTQKTVSDKIDEMLREIEGADANAKAVGEIIAQMQNKIEELESKLNNLDISAIKISNNNKSI